MSRRVQIVIPDLVATQLGELAEAADEPVATLAARIVRDRVAHAMRDDKIAAPATPPTKAATMGRRPPWLEPYGGDEQWRRETWGAVVALHGRYPRQLEHLKDGWWRDEATTETLGALAAWRSEIDSSGRDPARSSRSTTSSPTTPTPSASKAAACVTRGSPERRR